LDQRLRFANDYARCATDIPETTITAGDLTLRLLIGGLVQRLVISVQQQVEGGLLLVVVD